MRRRQVARRHLGNPEYKGQGRSSEVGDLHVQRGAKVLAGDKLPFIHLTELDIVNVRRVEAGPVVTARNAAFGGGRHEVMEGFTIRQHRVVGDFMDRYGGVLCGGGMVHNGGD